MTLPELAIRRPITTLMILVSMFVVGGIALTRLPLAFLPEVDEPQIWVVVPYPNASPKTVERTVLREVPGLRRVDTHLELHDEEPTDGDPLDPGSRERMVETIEHVASTVAGPGASPAGSARR